MKLRTFRVLCYLCILCTCSVLSEEIGRENQPVLDVKSSSSDQEQKEPLDPNNPRDKRALGLILSGLAQVFGYTVDPIQIGSLPNPSPPPSSGARASGNNNQTAMNSTQSSSTTAAPRQRETIRFTGLVNLGNSTGLLTQLEQYERLFHGNGSSNATTAQPPTTTSTMPPQTTPSQPLEPRLLVKIPVPNVALPPLPAMPQPPLPEIPSQDIMLAYPQPIVTPRNQQQLTFRITETTDRLTVENKEIYDPKDVQSPPPPTLVPYVAEPPWKKEYEQRLAELERRQEEHAYRLKQQEWHRNRQKDNSHSGEEGHGGPKKQTEHLNRPSKCRKHEETVKNREPSEVEDLSRETYESEERAPELPERAQKPEESEEEEEEDRERYRAPQANENYTNVQYSEPLPLSEDDEQRRPEELRNSYGEPLHNRELYDEGGLVNYFGKFKQPLSDYYSSSAPSNSREDTSQDAKEESHDDREDEEESSESSREEDDIPARNKYEEYNLEEEEEPSRHNERVSEEDSSELPKNVATKEKNRSYFQEKKTTEERDYTKNMPLIIPVRYLSAPEELRKAKLRHSGTEQWERDNNVAKTEATKKIAPKEPRRPKKENLKAVAFSERQIPKKLHEGEEKVLQMWPPPFDYVVDSTVHTNVLPVTPPSINNSKVRGNRRKPESSDKGKGNRQQQRRKDSKANFQYGRTPEEQKMISRPANSERIRAEEIVSDPNDSKDSWVRYKYTSNNNHRNTERPKFETLKRSIEAPEFPIGNYYSEVYPAENKQQVNVKNPELQNVQVIRQESGTTATYDPRGGYNFFDFGKNVYGFDYGKESARMAGVFEGDKKVGNEETVGITVPQRDVYRYDESLTKFTSEPESKSEKVGDTDYANGPTAIRMMEQEQIPNAPIGYIDYSRLL
ncbi:unnamed protein product [Xylocopa violacea]|uniref:Uncharacterized protein n=1 Tax=Xylocopa violacea TaxID=135666 RepID=A0ABP1NQY5_XYLVO